MMMLLLLLPLCFGSGFEFGMEAVRGIAKWD
jgi:hypothetical protein